MRFLTVVLSLICLVVMAGERPADWTDPHLDNLDPEKWQPLDPYRFPHIRVQAGPYADDLAAMAEAFDEIGETILDEVHAAATAAELPVFVTGVSLKGELVRRTHFFPVLQETVPGIAPTEEHLRIFFNPRMGLKVPGGVQSPLMGLFHELHHALIFLEDPEANAKYYPALYGETDRHTLSASPLERHIEKEEMLIIRGEEWRLARKLNQPARRTHTGQPVRVTGPLSTQPW
ncbi:MAG: hypothetical protein E2O56_00745 [Gammaproteobacteria bacterium]|nr:MAG: hypothetical protein E2O56_00745 [Gammaproteobacteria bacterium]